MNKTFESTPANAAASRHSHRGAIFALHILLDHPDIRTAYMEDCEALLRLLGKQAVWPPQVSQAVCVALHQDDEAESPMIAKHDGEAASIGALVKGRQGWRTYENTISSLYSKNPIDAAQ